MNSTADENQYGPWNPGIRSQLPSEYLHLSTIFRPENTRTSAQIAKELSDFTGLPADQLVVYRPERLVVHELLIRVSADFFVSDGFRYEDLGINFRNTTENILRNYIAPHMESVVGGFYKIEAQIRSLLEEELSSTLFSPLKINQNANQGLLKAFKRNKQSQPPKVDSIDQRDRRVLSRWSNLALSESDSLSQYTYQILAKITGAICAKQGQIRGDLELLTSLTTGLVCNNYGSALVGEAIEPFIKEAEEREGYRRLPKQDRPVVMNIKGASASGKSTMRPEQHKLADALDINWSDFALISPDIWRKYLLDYETLEGASKYAGTLTGHELYVVDQKIDRYMKRKAEQNQMSHLLIDRFRFDSFAPEPNSEEGSNLLTRFGDEIYMFFMITPPDATVDRAWHRGLQVGRYKAVDDLLDHNVEAYTGMPVLFFTWALRNDKSVHYEFIDNSVPKGQQPRSIAFGVNDEMNILDVKYLLDINRYTKININAHSPGDVYPKDGSMAPEHNTDFLKECVQKISTVNFVDYSSGRIYAHIESGEIIWIDRELFSQALNDLDTKAGIQALVPNLDAIYKDISTHKTNLDNSQIHTLGSWGQNTN